MNITVNSQNLAAELRQLNKIVPSKPAIAILSHTLVTAAEGITFHATDMEVAMTSPCVGHVDEPGSAAIPVGKLLQMVEQFPDADVNIAVDDKHVTIKCEAFASRLQTLPVEDFPTQPVVEGVTSSIAAPTLRDLIAKTRHAINATGTKHLLKGALLTFVGETVAMVTTDGKRLALATASRAGIDMDVVIPVKALDVLAGGTYEGDIELMIGNRHLFFSYKDCLLTSRKLEGTFPAYNGIIPRDNTNVVQVDRHDLCATMRRVVLTAEETSAVCITLSEGLMSLSSASIGIGSATEDLAVGYAGPPLKVYINGPYLLDFLNAASGQSLTIAFKDGKGSALLTDGNHLGVVSLMRSR